MIESQRNDLLLRFEEIHTLIHDLYPRGGGPPAESDKELRNRLLAVDLTMHLAQEVVSGESVNEPLLAERAANLLYALRLLAPGERFEEAAKTLLNESDPSKNTL